MAAPTATPPEFDDDGDDELPPPVAFSSRPWWTILAAAFIGIFVTLTVNGIAGLAAAITVVAAMEVVRRRRDVVSLLTLLLALTFLIPAQLVVVPLGGSASPATLLGLLLMWYWVVARLVPALGLDRGRQPMRIAILVWLWTIVASLGAAYARAGIDGEEVRATNRGIVVALAAAGITLLAADGIASRARLDALIRVFVWLGTALAAIGILQFTIGLDLASYIRVPGLGSINAALSLGDREGFRRVAGTATHPIEFAAVLCAVFPLSLYYGRLAVRRWARWIPLAIIGLAIPMSLSRTAGVALVVALLFLVPTWTWGRRLRALGIAVIGFVAVQFIYPGVINVFVGLFAGAGSDVSVTTRASDYSDAVPFIMGSPVFGRGFKTFDPTRYFFVDNQYLVQLIETGVVGLLAMIALFLVGITLARGARHRAIDPGTRELGQCLAASLAALMVCFFTFDALSFPMVTVVTFVLFGLAGALWRLVCDEEAERQADARPILTSQR